MDFTDNSFYPLQGPVAYLNALNRVISDQKLLYAAFLLTQVGANATATSTSSITVGTGAKTFTIVQGSRAWAPGMPIRISRTSDPTGKVMRGTVATYDADVDPHLVGVTVTAATGGGTGPYTDWSLCPDPTGGQVAADTLLVGAFAAAAFLRTKADLSGIEAVLGLLVPTGLGVRKVLRTGATGNEIEGVDMALTDLFTANLAWQPGAAI